MTYTPPQDYVGSDSFTYKVIDSKGADSNVATVTITVKCPVNVELGCKSPYQLLNNPNLRILHRQPKSFFSTNQSTQVDINLEKGASDKENDNLNASIVLNPSHGNLGSINKISDTVTYTPTSDYTGQDSFTYKVIDTKGADSNVATVSIKVNPLPNTPPTAIGQNVIATEIFPVAIILSGPRS